MIKHLFSFGPIFFGVGFVAPLIAQSLDALGWQAPGPLTAIQFGLIVGLAWGTTARVTGRWI